MPDLWLPVLFAVLALAFGGVLKGATGAGVPLIAVPVIALYFDVPTAVITMLVPSLVANILQVRRYRANLKDCGFAGRFALAGGVGGIVGSLMLTTMSPRILLLMVALVVLLYVGFRLARPGWKLPLNIARRASIPVGVVAGLLQGATGVSAPVSITFLSAAKLPRAGFVAAISLFFVASTTSQFAILAGSTLLTLQGMLLSVGALVIILATMPLGEALARRISPATFDRVILIVLTLVAIRILFGTVP